DWSSDVCSSDLRGLVVLFVETGQYLFTYRQTVDHNKVPGLHEADRGGVMSRRQDASQYLIRNALRQELRANIPAFEDGPVKALPLSVRKRVVVVAHSCNSLLNRSVSRHCSTWSARRSSCCRRWLW